MITLEKLRTYEEFSGDVDGWARAPTGKVESNMIDADWYLIDDLLMGLAAMGTGLASPSFVREFETRLLALTSDEATRSSLRALAVQQGQSRAA